MSIASYIRHGNGKSKTEPSTQTLHIEWVTFERSGAYGKWRAVEHEYTGPATIRGGFVEFDGLRKSLSGKHITITDPSV